MNDTPSPFLIRLALNAGYVRLAARAELLDRINVFPVADGDTGTNLRAALAPLGNAATCESLFLTARHKVTPRDRLMATIAPYHIYGQLFSVLLPLVSGASVAAASPAFPEEMAAIASKHAVSLFISVSAHYRPLALSGGAGGDMGGKGLAFSSAGPLDLGDNYAFCTANNVGIVEVFGSTETGGMAERNRHLGETDFTASPALTWRVSPEERLMLCSPSSPRNCPRTRRVGSTRPIVWRGWTSAVSG